MYKVLRILHALFAAIFEYIFPPKCINCGTRAQFLCTRCFQVLEYLQHEQTKKLDNCSISTLCAYAGIIKKLIALYKYQGVKAVGETLASLLYYCLPLPPHDCITWVPLHKQKEKIRGFNQTALIAKKLAQLTHKPAIMLLEKVTPTASQMSVRKHEQRLKNITNSIALAPHADELLQSLFPKQKKLQILLIDDVYTTSATITHCAAVLQKLSQSNVVHAVTVAHGQ